MTDLEKKRVPDIIEPNLELLFVGINPGMYTALVGFHFAKPGNRFWKALYDSGFTPTLLKPSESLKLFSYHIGIINLVDRPTLLASELSKEELRLGAVQLRKKILKFKPSVIAILGIGSYRIAFQKPHAHIGLQSESLENTQVWVLPNPSGLNAWYTPQKLALLFKRLHDFVEKKGEKHDLENSSKNKSV